jgi:hypothetical protein
MRPPWNYWKHLRKVVNFGLLKTFGLVSRFWFGFGLVFFGFGLVSA